MGEESFQMERDHGERMLHGESRPLHSYRQRLTSAPQVFPAFPHLIPPFSLLRKDFSKKVREKFCQYLKTPYLCTRFPKGRPKERDL